MSSSDSILMLLKKKKVFPDAMAEKIKVIEI